MTYPRPTPDLPPAYSRPTPDLLRGRSDLRHEEGGDTEVPRDCPRQVGKELLLKGGIVLYSWEADACGKRLAGPNNCI